MSKLINSRLRKTLKKVTQPQTGWLDVFPAVIGKADGTILTGVDGLIYARNFLNGQVLTVYNFVAPNIAGLQVEIGRKVETPGLWQVKGVRETYQVPAGGSQSSASHSHDNLFISRDRFMPFLVFPLDGTGFMVQVYGDVIVKEDGSFGSIASQQLDLSSHVPATGALYALIEADEDGVLYVTEGTPVDAKELLTLGDIPSITAGRKPSCAVRLYAGQAQLYRDPASINDFIDLRSITSTNSPISVLDDLNDVTIVSPSDGQLLRYHAATSQWKNVNASTLKYRQFVWASDGAGGWEFVSSAGEPVFNLENIQ
jgi:hypothetical protein